MLRLVARMVDKTMIAWARAQTGGREGNNDVISLRGGRNDFPVGLTPTTSEMP